MKKKTYRKEIRSNGLFAIRSALTLGVLFLTGTSLLLVISCEDFFEKDLEGKEVVIVSPADSLKTQYTTQNFWWEKLEGALTYNLQIASPSFDHVEKILIDTTVADTKFVYSLYPGRFQWRLRPVNGSSKGVYVVRSLEIDTTLDLRGQQIVLKNPVSDFATNKSSLKFSWDKIYNADDYRFEIHSGEWAGSKVISPVLTPYDTITIGLVQDGVYYWGVQGQNNGSATVYSTSKFFIDKIAPKTPVLTTPLDSATIAAWPVTLTWDSFTDNGSAIHDSIVVSTDRSFKSGSIKKSERVDGESMDFNLKDNGKYYWKVISADAAGNISPESEVNLFTIGTTSTP